MSGISGGGLWADGICGTYARRSCISPVMLRAFFASAEHEIGVVADDQIVAVDAELVRLLANKAAAGVNVWLALAEPTPFDDGGIQTRVCPSGLYSSIFRADEQLLVHQYINGVPADDAPVIHLRKTEPGDLYSSYLEGFESVWTASHVMPAVVRGIGPGGAVPPSPSSGAHEGEGEA